MGCDGKFLELPKFVSFAEDMNGRPSMASRLYIIGRRFLSTKILTDEELDVIANQTVDRVLEIASLLLVQGTPASFTKDKKTQIMAAVNYYHQYFDRLFPAYNLGITMTGQEVENRRKICAYPNGLNGLKAWLKCESKL
jgi:hypothetical protein